MDYHESKERRRKRDGKEEEREKDGEEEIQ
jgi:hypothetical protein